METMLLVPLVPAAYMLQSKKDDEVEEEKSNPTMTAISTIMGVFVFILAMYLFFVFHLKNDQESILYKVFMFIIASSFNILYVVYNLLFDSANTIAALKNFGTMKSF
jgi:heme/copper-type cytochrome/quinol oxidase subunit 2